jgi:hypothetical protein
MSEFYTPETGKRSLWERPMSQPEPPSASYQGNQQQAYQYPQDQAKGHHTTQPPPGYDQEVKRGGQGYGQQQQQPQVVYVNERRKKDHVALGFCAGCATGMCCCGCTVM